MTLLEPNASTEAALTADVELREQYQHLISLCQGDATTVEQQDDSTPVEKNDLAFQRLAERVLGKGLGINFHLNVTSILSILVSINERLKIRLQFFLYCLDGINARCSDRWLGAGHATTGAQQPPGRIGAAETVLKQCTDKPWNFGKRNSSHLPKGLMHTNGRFEYFVSGEAGGKSFEALADSGADECYVSSTLVSELGLSPEHGTNRRIQLGNKKHLESSGCVDIPWTFGGEKLQYTLKCWIIPGSSHALILGNLFLKISKTLTSFIHRIKKRLKDSLRTARVMLLGCEDQRLWGSLNGRQVAALPDTGCDVMLISEAAAAKFGLAVDSALEEQIEVEFGDGSRSQSIGVVKNAAWTVGEHTVLSDFYVLKELSVDVILSNDYLFEHKVFVAFEDYFFDTDSEEEMLFLRNIRLIGRFGKSLNLLEEDWRKDSEWRSTFLQPSILTLAAVNSPDAFSHEMIRKEVARRDLIRDQILELPMEQRQSATDAETERQRLWEQFRRAHQQNMRSVSSSSAGPSSTTENVKPQRSRRGALLSWLGRKRSRAA